MKFLKLVVSAVSDLNRRETLDCLQATLANQLLNSGFSPEVVWQGIGVYPWREDNQQGQPVKN